MNKYILALILASFVICSTTVQGARIQKDGPIVIDLLQSQINVTYELTETNQSQTDFNETWSNTTSTKSYYFELPKNSTILSANLTAIGFNYDYWNVSYIADYGNTRGAAIAVDSNKRIHACWIDDGNGGDLVYGYHDFEEAINTWHTTVVDNNILPASCNIKVDSSNNPKIIYRILGGVLDLKYAYYDGTWHTETIDSNVVVGDYALDLNSSGNPYILYTVESSDNCLMYYGSKSGTWDISLYKSIGTAPGATTCGYPMDIKIDNNDRSNIVWLNGTSPYSVYYAINTGTWTETLIQNVGATGVAYGDIDIDIDQYDNAYVGAHIYDAVIKACGNGIEWRIDYYYKANTSSSWSNTLCAIEDQNGDDGDGTELKVNNIDQYIYTAYDEDGDQTKIYRKPISGSTWELYYQFPSLGANNILSSEQDGKDSMVIDYEGKLYVITSGLSSGPTNVTYRHPHYVNNLAIDTGNDGNTDFTQSNKYNNNNNIDLNITAISNSLTNCIADSNGNCDVEISLTSDLTSSGIVQIKNINITYIYDLTSIFSYNENLFAYGTNSIYVDNDYYNFRNATSLSNSASQNIQITGFNISNYTATCLIGDVSYPIVAEEIYQYCAWSNTLSKGNNFTFNITENVTHVKELKSGLSCPTGYTDQSFYCERHIELVSTTENYYTFKLNATNNFAKDYNITYNISKSILDGWDDGSSIQIFVDSITTGVNYNTVDSIVQITVNTSHSASSLDYGIHNVEVFYVTPGGAPSEPGGGSPGGGGGTVTLSPILCGDNVCEYPEDAINCPEDCTAPFILDIGESGFTYPAVPGSRIVCLGNADGCDIIIENPTDEELNVNIKIQQKVDDSFEWAYLLDNDDTHIIEEDIIIPPKSFDVVTVGVTVPEDAAIGDAYSFHIVFESRGQKVFLPYNIQVVESLGIVNQIFTFLFSNFQFGLVVLPGWGIVMLILLIVIALISLSRRGGKSKNKWI
jgi:hypothetical protein